MNLFSEYQKKIFQILYLTKEFWNVAQLDFRSKSRTMKLDDKIKHLKDRLQFITENYSSAFRKRKLDYLAQKILS